MSQRHSARICTPTRVRTRPPVQAHSCPHLCRPCPHMPARVRTRSPMPKHACARPHPCTHAHSCSLMSVPVHSCTSKNSLDIMMGPHTVEIWPQKAPEALALEPGDLGRVRGAGRAFRALEIGQGGVGGQLCGPEAPVRRPHASLKPWKPANALEDRTRGLSTSFVSSVHAPGTGEHVGRARTESTGPGSKHSSEFTATRSGCTHSVPRFAWCTS